MTEVYSAPVLSATEVVNGLRPEEKTVRVQYATKEEFKRFSKQLGIMEDFKVSFADVEKRGGGGGGERGRERDRNDFFVECVLSQQFSSVSQERIFSGSKRCCHIEIEFADEICYYSQS